MATATWATAKSSSWTPAMNKYVQSLADEFAQSKEVESFDVDSPGSANTDTSFLQLSKYLASAESDATAPMAPDTSHPISDYYISSSHNTYLWGNQLYGRASTEAYRNVLERGCRCVEIDVWDGESDSDESGSSSDDGNERENEGEMTKLRRKFKKKVEVLKSKAEGSLEEKPVAHQGSNAKDGTTPLRKTSSIKTEPRVLHGHTATREVPFRDVCATIRDHAFTQSLEIHTCPEQQQMMVDIMKEYWAPHLVNLNTLTKQDIPLPALETLRKKILIKVKYSSPEKASSTRTAAASKNADPDSSEDEAECDTTKKSKIIPALGCMGVYTRSYHFKSFDQPEAKIPTHIFSLSENKLLDMHKRDASVLFKHNKIVALNWQYVNAAMMLNQGMFHFTGGWVLKPEGYRSLHTAESQFSALRRGTLDLSIEVFAGQNIGPVGDKLRPYIRCELHTEDYAEMVGTELPDGGRTKDGQIKTSTEVGKGGRNPDFAGQVLEFKHVPEVSEELTFVRFKVMDDDTFSRDNLVAWACFRLDRLRTGIRTLRLYSIEGQPTDGILLVRIGKSIKM